MIWKEPLSKEDIQIFLKSYISAQIFGLRTGLYVVSIACLFMTMMAVFDVPILMNSNVSSFEGIFIILLSCIVVIAVPVWGGLKSEKFKIVFEIVTIPVTFIISIFCKGKYLLLTNSFLLLVLIIVFIYKYANYSAYKSGLTTKNEKVFLEGILTKCYKQDISISVRYSDVRTIFTVDDGSNNASFSLDGLKIMQLFNAGQNIPKEEMVGKKVILSFLSAKPETLLSFRQSQ